VMSRQQEIADLLRRVVLEDRGEGGEVLGRVRHLVTAAKHDQAGMRPVPGERHLARERLTLRDLVFVVGKDQVGPATMDVELLAQRFADHSRALDVPAGAAATPGARPRRLAWLGRLPQREITRIAFAWLELFARGHQLAVEV